MASHAPGSVLGSKAKDVSKSLGLDRAFDEVERSCQTDAERQMQEEQSAAERAPGGLRDILKMPEALKVLFLSRMMRHQALVNLLRASARVLPQYCGHMV